MSLLDQAGMLARLTRDIPRFLRSTISTERSAAIVERRLETRPERFLEMAEQLIYRHPRSPYLQLLRSAGCEPGDLRALVTREGLENALTNLADQGIHFTFDEFKGGEVVRGSQRFVVVEEDFDNPMFAAHFEQRTGGTRSRGTSVKVSLQHLAELGPGYAVALQAHGLTGADHILWLTGPIFEILLQCWAQRPPLAWFYPLEPLPWRVRLVGNYLRLYTGLLGYQLPSPVWNDLQNPGPIARQLASHVARGCLVCVTTNASSAVRVALAAREQDLSLDCVCFITMGEAFTDAKQDALQVVGARALVRYGSQEARCLAQRCAEPSCADDVHVFSDCYEVIQRRRMVGAFGLSVDAFLLTSLLQSAPKIMLNVEIGDHGTLEKRDCGCALGALGLRDHLSNIRSHEKLTGEGMTFVRTRLLRTLEEVLPAKFGGTVADYQVLEQEDKSGILRLFLLVDPRLGTIDEVELQRTFLTELAEGGELEEHMARMWRRAGTVQIRREAPRPTRAGKVQPFHTVNRRVR